MPVAGASERIDFIMNPKNTSAAFAVLAMLLYCGAAAVAIGMLVSGAGNVTISLILALLLMFASILVAGAILLRRKAARQS